MEFCPTVVWPVIPVWVLETMVVDMKLLEIKARREGVDLVNELYAYEKAKYRDYVQLYTDGSKDPEAGTQGLQLQCLVIDGGYAEGPLIS